MRSHIGRENLLILEILLQGDAARHDGCELDVVQSTCAGVFGQVFFDDLASNPANPSDKASDGCGVEKRFHELVVRHGGVYIGFNFHRLCLRIAAAAAAPFLSVYPLTPGTCHRLFLRLGC